ncbi:MAG: hypothetical protein LRS43_02100 [Desulfurococcales archaeon]|nr:hypothetical protein [Desulfurococcales archaeon]
MYRVILTTSRRPNNRVRSFVKELYLTLPKAIRLNRGHLSMEELAREALLLRAERVVIVSSRRGNPGIIRFYSVEPRSLTLVNLASIIVRGVSLAREGGRGYPGEKPRGLYVSTDKTLTAREFGRALTIGLGALMEPAPGLLEARIRKRGKNTVSLSFFYEGKPVGPRLLLSRPQHMIKQEDSNPIIGPLEKEDTQMGV